MSIVSTSREALHTMIKMKIVEFLEILKQFSSYILSADEKYLVLKK